MAAGAQSGASGVPAGAGSAGAPPIPGSRDGWRPPSGGPAGSRPRSRALEVALAVVIVAIVVVALLILGVIPGLHPAAPAAASGGFASARAAAQNAANAYDGGNWSAIAASAVVPSTAIDYPLNGSPISAALNGSGCVYTALAAGTETVAGAANVSQGDAGAWLFIFRNASDGLLLVSDTPESVTLVGTVDGGCTAVFGFVSAIPTSVVDSSTAAQAADVGGGYAFLQAHPQANGSLTVFGGASIFGASSPPFWTVGYSDCPLAASPATTAAAFTANVSAVSGALLTARAYVAQCPAVSRGTGGPRSLGGALELGPATDTLHGRSYTYATTIVSAVSPLAAGDLVVSVQSATGQSAMLPAASSVNLTTASGEVLASCSLGAAAWSTGGAVGLAAGEILTVTTSTNLTGQGYVIVLAGTDGYTGSVVTGIP